MTLTWNDYEAVAQQLFKQNPQINPHKLTPIDICRLVVKLPDFTTEKVAPDRQSVQAIMTVLTELRFGKINYPESTALD